MAAAAALAAATPAAGQDREYDCLIEARQLIEVRSPVEGLIDKVLVRRGGLVRRGEVLAVIESSVERAAVETARARAAMEGEIKVAQARLELNTRKMERAQELHKEKFISDNARDEAVAEFRLASEELRRTRENQALAQSELARAVAALDLRSIRAPFDGVVVDVMLRPGELAATATVKNPVMKLAEIDPLHVEVVLPSRLYGSIRLGQAAVVLPEAPLNGSYASKVKVVDRVIDAASGTFGVRLELPNPKGRLPAGSRCRVRF